MSKLNVEYMVLGRLQNNCYYIFREGQNIAFVVDPADKADVIFHTLKEKGLQIGGILITHGHFDHIMAVNQLKELAPEAPIFAGREEADVLEEPSLNCSSFLGRTCSVTADVLVKEGETIELADMKCRVIETPGHTKGGVCYYFEEDGVLLSGDTLFFESIGNTEFPTGNAGVLRNSVVKKLYPLPDETNVYPGHGEMTTIGHEKSYNPFCIAE